MHAVARRGRFGCAGLVPTAHRFTTTRATRTPAPCGRDDRETGMTKPLAHRIALITGASRGIGYATAIALAQEGAHVVATARTTGGLEELDDVIKSAGGTATLVPVDMRDYDGIGHLAGSLNERYGKLDILIGNAALVGSNSPLDHYEPKEWDDVMAVNVTANWNLIRHMNGLLRRSDAGRAVFITSGSATSARAYRGL